MPDRRRVELFRSPLQSWTNRTGPSAVIAGPQITSDIVNFKNQKAIQAQHFRYCAHVNSKVDPVSAVV